MHELIRYKTWLQEPSLDAQTRAELQAIADNPDEIKLRFGSELAFGTAGLRGVMRAGTDAMNLYTVGRATQGLASYILAQGQQAALRGVVISYDCRNHSEEFASLAAEILAGNGITVYLFDSMRPTPVLSFAVLQLHCIAGINITASHNPKEYNGYKVYWEDGAQISGEIAREISEHIANTPFFHGVHHAKEGTASPLVHCIGSQIDQAYLMQVQKQLICPEIIAAQAQTLRIVYTPLYGTGRLLVPLALQQAGITNLQTVPGQCAPNGDFPGVPFPNPEYPQAFEQGICIAEEVGSNLIIATDPDADRVGVMARGKDGKFATISGNQMGCLLLDYIIGALKRTHRLPQGAYAVKSIVSTALADRICQTHGVRLFATYTGFKYIAQAIEAEQHAGCDGFLLGFEESYGYLRGIYAKDKDAVVATLLICEMAAYYQSRGMTLLQALDALYARYGYYADGVDNIYMEGANGNERRKAFMHAIRTTPPQTIGDEKVAQISDYLCMQTTDLISKTVSSCATEPADMLRFVTESGNCIIVRPSGTEPKVKLYYQVRGKDATHANTMIQTISAQMKEMFEI